MMFPDFVGELVDGDDFFAALNYDVVVVVTCYVIVVVRIGILKIILRF